MSVVRRSLAAALGVLIALTGCAPVLGGDRDRDRDRDEPTAAVADDVLFEQVADLDGVATADVRYQEVFGYPPTYAGTITVDPGADPLCVLDEALSVLHQGRRGAYLGVEVHAGERIYGVLSLVDRPGDVDSRYGPVPHQPQPSATVAPCAPPDVTTASPTP